MGGVVKNFFSTDGSSTAFGDWFSFLIPSSVRFIAAVQLGLTYQFSFCVSAAISILRPCFSTHGCVSHLFIHGVRLAVSRLQATLYVVGRRGAIPSSGSFSTPGADDVNLLLPAPSFGGEEDMPPMAESTFVRSDVSADMLTVLRDVK